ncbi:MAG: alanine--glyoxylate aminotransferase family protein [Deltaproteobacteria bacterium]|nr:alanine--glyoxylate aminotransferase family protein [Deltaproteobacteria bacterium]
MARKRNSSKGGGNGKVDITLFEKRIRRGLQQGRDLLAEIVTRTAPKPGARIDARVADATEIRTNGYIEKLLEHKEYPKYVLLNPGPVQTTAQVKNALVQHDICHRDSDFSDILRSVEEKLLNVMGAEGNHRAFVITGSGTSGMECAISSAIPEGKKLVVVSNGAFGDRIGEIAELHRIPVVDVRFSWAHPVRVAEVERALADPDVFAVAMVHHETSIGLLNPIRDLGRLAAKYDKLFIVDCVSSLGGERFSLELDQIDIAVSSANKCLHAVSGLAVVAVHQRVWDRIRDVRPRVYYLDLKRYMRYAVDLEQTPFTPAVNTLFALDRALGELLAEGVEERIKRYESLNALIRRGLAGLGVEPFTETGCESHTISSFFTPESIAFDDLYRELKNRGFIIYNAKEHLKDRVFQVANMGALTRGMIYDFLFHFEQVLKQHQRSVAKQSRAHLAVI